MPRPGFFKLKPVIKRLFSLLRTPLFWVITLVGNTYIFLGALCFYFTERERNPALLHFLDALNWAVGIVTTVGASNVYPVTFEGKLLGIFMMLGGALFLWTYMALFVGALVDPELKSLEKEVSEIQKDVHLELKSDEELLKRLQSLMIELETVIRVRKK